MRRRDRQTVANANVVVSFLFREFELRFDPRQRIQLDMVDCHASAAVLPALVP